MIQKKKKKKKEKKKEKKKKKKRKKENVQRQISSVSSTHPAIEISTPRDYHHFSQLHRPL